MHNIITIIIIEVTTNIFIPSKHVEKSIETCTNMYKDAEILNKAVL